MTESDVGQPALHPWLHVPLGFVEPLGAMAIAAGRVELSAALSLRALLRPLDWATTQAITPSSFNSTLNVIRGSIKSEAVREADPTLESEWKAWEQRARGFMQNRNRWLHGSWAADSDRPGVYMLITRTGPHPDETLDAAQITDAAREGMQISIDGAFYWRFARLLQSDAYARQTAKASDEPGWIGL